MMYQSTYYSSEAYTKPAHNHGTFEYLKQYAKRLLEAALGLVEVRNADGRLCYKAWTEADGTIIEWENA